MVELRSLQQVLILTNAALKKYESTPLGEPLVDFIRPEVHGTMSFIIAAILA